MLCHTDHALRVVDPARKFTQPYDAELAPESTRVVYPALLQRRSESEVATVAVDVATAFFTFGWGKLLRDWAFEPTVYTCIDVVNMHGSWFTFVLLPALTLLCITNTGSIGAAVLLASALLCWAFGFR